MTVVQHQALDTGAFVDTLYTWSAFNTEAVGYSLAKALVSLVSFYSVENIHLIGMYWNNIHRHLNKQYM